MAKVAVDGIVEEGESEVDESMVTDESLPVHKEPAPRSSAPRVVTLVALALLLGGTGALAACTSSRNPVAEGRAIFEQGVGPDGRSIARSGARGGMMGGGMMRAGCAACHGADGAGASTPMFVAPNITYANLTDPAGMREPTGERGPTYTRAQVCRAVTRGIDAEGGSLSGWMPRWNLTAGECDALIAFLKTLR